MYERAGETSLFFVLFFVPLRGPRRARKHVLCSELRGKVVAMDVFGVYFRLVLRLRQSRCVEGVQFEHLLVRRSMYHLFPLSGLLLPSR